jgi:hypothetical protein
MRAALVVPVLGACWRSSPPIAPADNTGTPASTPAPSIAWDERHIVDRWLPAIAHDGSVVVLGIEEPDGARGNPNFRIELRGRDDRIRSSHDVLTVNDVDSGAFFDETGPLPPLRDRIANGNAHLANLHATHRLVPLKKMTLENAEDAPLANQTAHGGNLVIAWKDDHVVVTDERGDGKTVLLDLPAPVAWLAAPRRTSTHACTNPAFLDETWASPEHRLAVITVNYEGTDICWEPNAQHHVITW